MPYKANNNKHKNILPPTYNTLTSTSRVNSMGMNGPDIEFYELEPAEVLDVIYNDQHPDFKTYEDIGKARVRLLYSQKNFHYKDISKLNWAKPGDSNVKDYPLKHEIVIVSYYITREGITDMAGPDITPKGLYYFNRLNVLNSVNHNAMQDISVSYKFKTGPNYIKPQILELGDEIQPNNNIHPLESKEGDRIYEGRFGHSIRFGNNVESGEPEILDRKSVV